MLPGPQRELDQLVVFQELAALLPNIELDVHLVGPDVPMAR